MADPAHPERKSNLASSFEKLSSYVPVIALISGGLFVLGLFVAYCIDSKLGVGTVEVSRERAVCLGIALLLVLLPLGSLWFSFREGLSELSSEDWRVRCKACLQYSFESFLMAGLLTLLGLSAGGGSVAALIGTSTLLPIFLASYMTACSKSNARRFVRVWPLFGVIFVFIPLTTIGSWLPVQFGGHAGPELKLILKDGAVIQGLLKVSDSKVVVVQTGDLIKAVSRDDIKRIESIASPASKTPQQN